MYRRILLRVLVLVVFLDGALCLALPTLELEGERFEHAVGNILEILEDPSGTLTFSHVAGQTGADQWLPSTDEVPNFGFTESAYWFRFQIKNSTENPIEWVLEVVYPVQDHLSYYLLYPDGSVIEKHNGDQVPFSQRDIRYHNLVIKGRTADTASTTLYIRAKTSSSMQLPLVIRDPVTFSETKIYTNFLYGIYYGGLAIMAAYNLLLFFSLRVFSYLYYVLYVVSWMLFTMGLSGHALQFLWPNSTWWASQCMPVTTGATNAFLLIFARSFLETKQHIPKLDRLMQGAMFVGCFVALASLALPYRIGLNAGLVLTLVTSILLLTAGTICVRKGARAARHFLIAFSAFLLGTIIIALMTFGVLPNNWFTSQGQRIGSVLEILLFSIALGEKLKMMQKDKHRLESELETARTVQVTLLPRLTQFPGVSLAARYVPAAQVGGDWYGVYYDRGRHCLNFLIGDVTGHGIGSALLTGVASGAVSAVDSLSQELASMDAEAYLLRLAHATNQAVLRAGRGAMMMTMCFLNLDLLTGKLTFVNAGHNFPYLLQTRQKKLRPVVLAGPRLGAPKVKFSSRAYDLEPGDVVFMYTDGLVENHGPRGIEQCLPENLLRRKLRKLLLGETNVGVDTFVEQIHGDAEAIWQGYPADDDMSMLAFQWERPITRTETHMIDQTHLEVS